jgi:hypothetical protein
MKSSTQHQLDLLPRVAEMMAQGHRSVVIGKAIGHSESFARVLMNMVRASRGGTPANALGKRLLDELPRVKAMMDAGASTSAIAKELGWSDATAQRRMALVRAAMENGTPPVAAVPVEPVKAEPKPDTDGLSTSAAERLKHAVEVHRRRLERHYDERLKHAVNAEVARREKAFLDLVRPRLDAADEVRRSWNGVMERARFKQILRILHPDNSAGESMRADAFRWWRDNEALLCKPDVPATPYVPLDEALRRKHR